MNALHRKILAAATAAALAAACASFTSIDGGTLTPDAAAPDAPDVLLPGDAAPNEGYDATPPPMVQGAAPDSGTSFYIDPYEATVGQYDALTGQRFDGVMPQECVSRTLGDRSGCTIDPHSALDARTSRPDEPVNCVEWCDAYVYCALRGKRLCGALGDGAHIAGDTLLLSAASKFDQSEWELACGGPRGSIYPFDSAACNVNYVDDGGPGSRASCEGSAVGVFDLGGSLAEWINGQDKGSPLAIGPAYRYTGSDITCRKVQAVGATAGTYRYDNIGIRCCSDASQP